MPKKKLKNTRCIEIDCRDCPLDSPRVPCSVVCEDSSSFGDIYKKLKKLVNLIEKDLEKEVEVNG